MKTLTPAGQRQPYKVHTAVILSLQSKTKFRETRQVAQKQLWWKAGSRGRLPEDPPSPQVVSSRTQQNAPKGLTSRVQACPEVPPPPRDGLTVCNL